jgi:hypothetical protein
MVAVNEPVGQVQAFRTRVSYLDTNGVPTPGASNSYVSASLVTMSITPVYKDGTHIEQENGEGTLCVNWDGDDSLLRCDFELTICKPDPYLQTILVEGSKNLTASGLPTTTGNPGVAADADRPYGWAMPALGPITSRRVSIEVWTKRIDDGELKDVYPYAWWVLPSTRRRRLGQTTLANAAVVPVISGKAYENDNWFDGPRENWPTSSDRVLQWIPCKVAEVPTASDQYTLVSAS